MPLSPGWRAALAVFAGTVGLSAMFWCGARSNPVSVGRPDAELYLAIIQRLKSGESYYRVAGEELHVRGYATLPRLNWRLPTLAVLQSRLPSLEWSRGLVIALALVTLALWCRFLPTWTPVSASALAVLLLATLPAWAIATVRGTFFHDLWGGQFIALSLAAWSPARWWPSVALGACALAFRELAFPYAAVMTICAIRQSRHREALAWVLLMSTFAIFLAWHLSNVTPFIPPDAVRNSWTAAGGWCFVLAAGKLNAALIVGPMWVTAVALPVSVVGLGLWRTETGVRVFSTVLTYLLFFTLFGRPDNWYWGLLIAPLLPLGIVQLLLPRREPPQLPARLAP